jgi:hypothetical protein
MPIIVVKPMPPKVYVETSVVSYLSSRPSRDLVLAAHQQITRQWWETRRQAFDLHVSQAVIDEAGGGDEEAAGRRLQALEGVPLLDITDEVAALAEDLIHSGPLPPKAAVDAVHIATAVVGRMDYLLTWNCKHIANAAMRNKIEQVCRSRGYEPVVICTPEELLEA